MEKVQVTSETCPGIVNVREIQVNTYIPEKVHCHVITQTDAEKIDKIATENEKMKKFFVDYMVDALEYRYIKKGDIIYISSKSDNYSNGNAPKYIGVFSEFGVDRVLDDGTPVLYIQTRNTWTIGSKFMKPKYDVPNIVEGAVRHSFIPDVELFKPRGTTDFIRKPTENELIEYRKAFQEFIDKTYIK